MENQYKQYRIVADSAADLIKLDCIPYAEAPLKVIAGDRQFVDTADLDVAGMVDYLKTYKGKSSSSCPNPDEWLEAFGDAEYVLGVAISGGISGCYNAAMAAKRIYEADHPGRRVHIVDSLSAGPGEAILVEKLEELIRSGKSFDEICKEIEAYRKKTQIVFVLESLTNFANNGRVSHAVAKIAGLLGICIMCKASEQGTIETVAKCRGWKKSYEAMINLMKNSGFNGGKIRISHCFNESGAQELKAKVLEAFHKADVKINQTGGLCSFYAEKGGLLMAYETV